MTLCHAHRKNDPFVRFDKRIVYDNTLSWKATGILSYAFSRPDDWTFYKSEMIKHKTDGEASFDSGIKELESTGYLHRFRKQCSDTGQMEGWEWHFFEVPISDEEFKKSYRQGGFPVIGKTPISVKSPPTKKDSLNKKEETTTEESPEINPPKPKNKNKNKNSSSSSDYCVKKEAAIKHIPLTNQTKYNLQRFSLEILTYAAAEKLPKNMDSLDRWFFKLCMRLEDGTQSMEEKSSSTEATVASVKSTVQDMFKEVEFPEEYRVEFVKTGYHLFQGHSIAATVGYGEPQCIQATEKIIKYLKEQNVTG